MASDNKHEDVKSIAANGYNAHAGKYNAWTQSRAQGLELRIQMLGRLLAESKSVGNEAKGLRVLELGCGAGDPITLRLAKDTAVGSVVANDISSTQLALLRGSLAKAGNGVTEKVELLEGDMMALDFEEGTLDAVVAFYSLIHLEQADQKELVGRCHRWLKTGIGHLLCCFGSREDPGGVIDDWLGMKAYWSSWGAEKSIEMVEAAEFEVVFKDIVHEQGDAEFLWVVARKVAKGIV